LPSCKKFWPSERVSWMSRFTSNERISVSVMGKHQPRMDTDGHR
jgi:hypothetical protein